MRFWGNQDDDEEEYNYIVFYPREYVVHSVL